MRTAAAAAAQGRLSNEQCQAVRQHVTVLAASVSHTQVQLASEQQQCQQELHEVLANIASSDDPAESMRSLTGEHTFAYVLSGVVSGPCTACLLMAAMGNRELAILPYLLVTYWFTSEQA